MNNLKRTMAAWMVGMSLTAASAAMAIDSPNPMQQSAELQRNNADVIEALLADGKPRALVLAATALKYGGDTSAPAAERQRELLNQAVLMGPNDALVQWIAAVYASPLDGISEPALALQRLEPDNGAIWMFQLAAATRANDSAGITEMLQRIGISGRFDDHSSGYALEWLKFFEAHPWADHYPQGEGQARTAIPLIMAISRAAALALPNYVGPTQVCKSAGQSLAADRRAACLAAGRLMLTKSYSLDSMRIGAAMLRLADADDATEITRNTEYFTEEYIVFFNDVMMDSDGLDRYQADWLQSGSRLQADRNLLTRSGIPLLPPPDWKPDPNRFTSMNSKRKDR